MAISEYIGYIFIFVLLLYNDTVRGFVLEFPKYCDRLFDKIFEWK